MMQIPVKILMVSALAAFLCSCSSVFGPHHYDLTDEDSGRTLHLDQGDTVTVQLVSNPTTGFQWQFAEPPLDGKIMVLREDMFIQPQEQLCGAPGKRRLSLLAEGSGRTGLRLVYVRPWEKNRPPAKEFSLELIVGNGTDTDGNGIP